MVAQSSGGTPGERSAGAFVSRAVGRTAAAVLGVCALGMPLTAAARHHDESRESKPAHEDSKPGHEYKARHDDSKPHEDSASKKVQADDKLPSGPLLLTVSISGQRVTVYDNGRPVASSQISSGMSGHTTPTGIFSIIQKQKWHHSNLYSNAPMPYMQRITWSGVALHAGVVPGYPASHGCIRLPEHFAVHLYGMTRVGARVIVGRGNMAPYLIEHPRLAALATKPPEADQPSASRPDGTGKAGLSNGAVVVATTGAVSDDSNHRDQPADPAIGAGHAQNESGEPQNNEPQNEGPPGDAPPAGPPAAEAPQVDPLSRPGQLSLFVSRREGKLYVRKGFEPAFEVPITIANPDKPLGNHIFTAAGRRASEGGGIRWLAVSLGVDRAPKDKDKRHKGHTETADPRPMSGAALRQSALDALDRIELPPEAVARLSPLVAPGTSLTISDHGLGPETGKETDFIVVTQ